MQPIDNDIHICDIIFSRIPDIFVVGMWPFRSLQFLFLAQIRKYSHGFAHHNFSYQILFTIFLLLISVRCNGLQCVWLNLNFIHWLHSAWLFDITFLLYFIRVKNLERNKSIMEKIFQGKKYNKKERKESIISNSSSSSRVVVVANDRSKELITNFLTGLNYVEMKEKLERILYTQILEIIWNDAFAEIKGVYYANSIRSLGCDELRNGQTWKWERK